MFLNRSICSHIFIFLFISLISSCYSNDILGCGGFVKSHASLDFSKIEIGLYTRDGSLKEKTECAPTNGYYFLPLYEKGEYVLKVHPPAGWSFEPSQVELDIDGETDQCSIGQDINFTFNGFGITGKVITAGHTSGPRGINVQLVNEKGETRDTVTTSGGEFHFTPVIPGKYVVKASHSRWKLDPAQTVVQVKEGNTALPVGVLAVRGYDVSGSLTSFGSPIGGVYVLLYSKEEKPKFRVEGCTTALLQGVPDAPICYSITDANGEFKFGLVPAGEYKLLALAKSPGQNFLTYNIQPDSVPFAVLHDSLFIKNAFEVTGFSVVGVALSGAGGAGVGGARVALAGQAVATTDAKGQFTLTGLKPGVYPLSLQHEHCSWDEQQVSVTPSGAAGPVAAVAARWRVCGSLTPPEPRAVRLQGATERLLTAGDDGTWCTFLPPGTYTARVVVSEQEQREGLQFYPSQQQVSVSGAEVRGVSFGQVRARVRGAVRCAPHCPAALRVQLRPLAADGAYSGPPAHARLVDGEYTFEEVVPGSVEVSVAEGAGAAEARLCWRQAAHNVAVAQDPAPVPDFTLTGLALLLTVSHDMEIEYRSSSSSGVLSAAAGRSRHCVPPAERYTLTPRGCHRVTPTARTVDMRGERVPSATFTATAHAAVITIAAPEAATDVRLHVATDEGVSVEPLTPEPQGDEFVYTHTLYLAEGETARVWAESAALVVAGGRRALRGAGRCERALRLRAVRATHLAGRLTPPVRGVLVTLQGGDVRLTQTTKADGKYSFGPLDASVQYSISAEKESYVFEVEPSGDIRAHRLAEIEVQLVDDKDDAPLEGALVSVSGGPFRLNALSVGGAVRARSLAPASYYVKPHMKEYRFEPPHRVLDVADGQAHTLSFRGVRVAWSALGRAVYLGGGGAGGLALRASGDHAACPQQDAVCDQDGHFRVRGLVPGCTYVLQLKESSGPARLADAPPTVKVEERDAENIRLIISQPPQLTDVHVLTRAPNAEHYRALRLAAWPEGAGGAAGAAGAAWARLEPAGCSLRRNPGLLHALRLPADNRTYVLTLDSSLSRAAHEPQDHVRRFVSDGRFRSFEFVFDPKVRSSEQELRQSSLLVLPLLLLLGALYCARDRALALLPARRPARRRP